MSKDLDNGAAKTGSIQKQSALTTALTAVALNNTPNLAVAAAVVLNERQNSFKPIKKSDSNDSFSFSEMILHPNGSQNSSAASSLAGSPIQSELRAYPQTPAPSPSRHYSLLTEALKTDLENKKGIAIPTQRNKTGSLTAQDTVANLLFKSTRPGHRLTVEETSQTQRSFAEIVASTQKKGARSMY